MKRLSVFVVITALISACTVEIEENSSINSPDLGSKIVLPADVPTVFHASIVDDSDAASSETRTSYNAAGQYSWSGNETVALLLYKTVSKPCDYLKSVNYTTTDSGRNADFTLDATSLYAGHNAPEEGWSSSGIAVYPHGMMMDHISLTNGYGAPFVKIRSSLKYGAGSAKRTGDSSEIILLGTPDGDHFSFKTAMAVLKVTMTGIPADAAALQLFTMDQDTYPLSGDFKLRIEGDKEIKNTDYTLYNSGHTGDPYISIDLSSDGAIDSRDFYFNIPTATYPANTLKIRLLDANGNVMMQRSIQKAFTFNRNDMVTATLACPSSMSVYMSGAASTPRINWNTKVRVFRFCIDELETNDPSSYESSNKWTNGSYAVWNTGANLSLTEKSGKYYFHYLVCSDTNSPSALTDNNVVAYGTIPFYYITSADAALRCGHYDYASGTIAPAAMAAKPEEGSITFAVSNDASKGNIMITEFGSFSYLANGAYNTTIGVTPASNGTPLYGVYKAANSLTGNYDGVVFNNTFDKNFFTAGGYNYWLGAKGAGATNTILRFAFDNDAWGTGSKKDVICWDEKATLFYNSSSSTKIEITNYCANLNLINKCTVSSNSESGSNVATLMVDGNPESFWHSIWGDGDHHYDSTYGIYFDIGLPSSLKSFQISYYTRADNNNVVPRKFKYWTRSGEGGWVPYSDNDYDASTDETRAGARVALPSITPAASFDQIRVRIVESNASDVSTPLTTSGSTAIAELQLYGSAE